MIAYKDNPDEAIGTICFWHMEPNNYRAEIGYMLHPNHWRKGILSEAIEKIIDYGLNVLNLHSIAANVNPNNAASIALLEKFGFKKEAHFTENWYYNDRFLDSAIYCKVKGK
jgi:ribosomal-protein-alanine N-acetyltransferase